MQLNESTYETIFLLYIDNELSPKERLEVEDFIADNPSYALEMDALKATVLSTENIPYTFKENLKKLEQETSVEVLDQEWDATYATILKEDMQAIPGLSTSFQNALKKDKSFLHSIQSTRIGNNNTSAYQFNLEKTPIKNEILNTISKTSNY